MRTLILSAIFAAVCTKALPVKKSSENGSKLIVISMDGLMPSEVTPDSMPFISKLSENGVFCSRLQSVFPTKTLVNHFSIATGLYAGSHGVTANVVYDNKYKKLLTYSREIFTLRPNVTPIWTLNELAGKHSAVSMWSAGEFDFRGVKPTYYERFNRSVPWQNRIDNIIPLLKQNESESQVDLVMFYIDHPDFEDHAFSTSSQEVLNILKDMDNMVKYLSERLDDEGLSNVTDIIILSDHGMDNYYFNRDDVDGNIIDLHRIVGNETCDMYGSSPVYQVIAKDGFNQTEICYKLKGGAAENGNYNVYFDDELKERWHIKNEQRFGPCTVVANPGYVFQYHTEILKSWTDYDKLVPGVSKFGVHGYDNTSPLMQAVFMANGPRFKNGVKIPFIQNIDLYHLFARLLNIESLAKELDLDGVDRLEIWNQMLTSVAVEQDVNNEQ